MITTEVNEYIGKSVLCWLATVDKKGEPNVSPKEVFCAKGDRHLLIANIASPQSVKNILENEMACVSFVDVFEQKGFKVKGKAKVYPNGSDGYSENIDALAEIAGPDFAIRHVIEVDVESAVPIIAPRYRFYANTTVDQQVNNALEAYGVTRPRNVGE